jgi:hypothetical protein
MAIEMETSGDSAAALKADFPILDEFHQLKAIERAIRTERGVDAWLN